MDARLADEADPPGAVPINLSICAPPKALKACLRKMIKAL